MGQGVPRPRKEEETTTSTPPIEGSSPPIEGDATQHERRVTKRAARKAARKHAARTALSGRVSSEARTELSAAADGVPRSEEARQEVLRLADEEAKRVLEAARVWAELLEVHRRYRQCRRPRPHARGWRRMRGALSAKQQS